MPASFEFDLGSVLSRLNEGLRRLPQEGSAELYQYGEEVMGDSKERVPVDTGALMNSGKTMAPEREGDEITVTLGYGDEAVDYAAYVHENLDSNVHWTRPGSGPKFLENPLKETQDELPGRLGDAVKRSFGG